MAPAEEIEQPIAIPGPNESVNFAQHIKPLFRKMDHDSMSFVFDLWAHADVRTHAPEILKRLENGTMPWAKALLCEQQQHGHARATTKE